ncbi:MAG: glycoside hydrolase family 78 protein [Candidatus Symbiothrix sp.]|jgi:alpha-L-rhamnosidase|nr:glycoside hydrolase family 78 protein [Candidatus Symbiothrix sp.]
MFRNISLFLLSIFACTACTSPSSVHDLRCENLIDPLSIDSDLPRLSWKNQFSKGEKQTAYQLLAATDSKLLQENKADLWNSGKVASQTSVMVNYAGKPLNKRTLVYWKVRVWKTGDEPSAWSSVACFGTSLTDAELQAAAYIGFPKDAGNPQSPFMCRQFDWDGNGRALLYVNSLGNHEVYLNGVKVGDQVLAPAMSQFNKRSLYLTYDVTPYLTKGGNDLLIWLGRGWYVPGLPGVVYEGPLVKARLDAWQQGTWRSLVLTDENWKTVESAYSGLGNGKPHHFGGEWMDASMLPDDMTTPSLDRLNWISAAKIEVPAHAVSPQMTECNRITETIKAQNIKKINDSTYLVDMGTTLTGWATIQFPPLQKGQKIRLKYGDHFGANGELNNMGHEDIYIASGKKNETFYSKFNYHSFQYITISNLQIQPKTDAITGSRIQTGYEQTSSFQCSDADLNAIHDIVRNALRNLSLGGYLVDCSHIERLGYGGDGNASTETAQTMFDLSPLYANWMQAWADCIREDGGMPHTAPNPYSAGGGPYWCGFIITASWRTYVNYNDSRLLERYYPQMQQWLGYVDKYSVDGLLKPWPETNYRGWYLGDWACPTGVDQTNPLSIDVVNNSFICVCYEKMEKIAKLLGKEADAIKYAEIAKQWRLRVQENFYSTETGIYATGSQIDLVFPMLAGVTPKSLLPKVTENLFVETEQNRKGHIACGLVGIPVITEWAVKNHQPDWIYSMLKKRDYPGYLYMIDNGATSTWEHWNGERSRIHNCYNGIGSWFYQAVGGIRPDENEAGYRKIWIDPQIPTGVTWAKTSKNTPYGEVALDWTLNDSILTMDLTVPSGSTAYVILPEKIAEYTLDAKTLPKEGATVAIEGGKYRLEFNIK